MRRAIVALFLAVAACADTYQENDLELLTAYRAKELCSCLFVMEQTEDYCARWTVQSPNLATFRVDRAKKRVTTSALVTFGASARWAGPKAGCTLD